MEMRPIKIKDQQLKRMRCPRMFLFICFQDDEGESRMLCFASSFLAFRPPFNLFEIWDFHSFFLFLFT